MASKRLNRITTINTQRGTSRGTDTKENHSNRVSPAGYCMYLNGERPAIPRAVHAGKLRCLAIQKERRLISFKTDIAL